MNRRIEFKKRDIRDYPHTGQHPPNAAVTQCIDMRAIDGDLRKLLQIQMLARNVQVFDVSAGCH
ncbi:hypothetical protein FBU59_005335 [Linderina macrospora]|uniref:Uncharacterized protein n=1 Tax=Linderina macrospora TaxID=4868 RepID=A0ACC1J2W8_9FUNG|nr:hypothetical protein FBU59_005335 [Linderina macrospora]